MEATGATRDVSYADLYARWERGAWRAAEIDLTQDALDWRERISEDQRRALLWLCSLFIHGEDAVADDLAPYIDAAPLEEQKYFLATQQADEARHAVFFARFIHEVVGVGNGSAASAMSGTEDDLSWGHHRLFERLSKVARQLREDPSPERLARAVTLYHVIVEATIAQPGQHLLEDALEHLDLLPGLREGMRRIAADEQRHIAFGVKVLADLQAADPGPIRRAMASEVRTVLPWAAAVAAPPDGDEQLLDCLGVTLEGLYAGATASFEQKLRATGFPLDEPLGMPYDFARSSRENAQEVLGLLRAGLLGAPGPAARDEQSVAALWEIVRRQLDLGADGPRTVVQFELRGVPAVHLRLGDRAVLEPGRHRLPGVVIAGRWDDWVDVVAGRASFAGKALRGRLIALGDPRAILRLRAAVPG